MNLLQPYGRLQTLRSAHEPVAVVSKLKLDHRGDRAFAGIRTQLAGRLDLLPPFVIFLAFHVGFMFMVCFYALGLAVLFIVVDPVGVNRSRNVCASFSCACGALVYHHLSTLEM